MFRMHKTGRKEETPLGRILRKVGGHVLKYSEKDGTKGDFIDLHLAPSDSMKYRFPSQLGGTYSNYVDLCVKRTDECHPCNPAAATARAAAARAFREGKGNEPARSFLARASASVDDEISKGSLP